MPDSDKTTFLERMEKDFAAYEDYMINHVLKDIIKK